ncbi:acyl-CoA dehydrogenase family protein [Anatilimnocola sp. NA78]|uniref:acyl-CoA dehydrogenase family protein n=1 Tax=Anatilimnocola sp. NA78 TaxID=3415683 RepID=UPI003CE49558
MNAGTRNPAHERADQSPVYRALWMVEEAARESLFHVAVEHVSAAVQATMASSLAVLHSHRRDGTLRGDDGKNGEQVIRELGAAGYWGLLVEGEYGGSGCGMRSFLPFLTRAAVMDSPFAGLAAVHGCIGAVDPLQAFGSESQKQKFLPALARGEKLSAFASTEPAAGSDLRRVRTAAIRHSDELLLTGQKAFITNLAPGRTIGLLCRVDDKLAVVIADLPAAESEQFSLVPNPLHPLRHTINQGARFNQLPIPLDSLLVPPAGKDGLAIVYHGLNRGRAAIAALAAGHLRTILGGMLAWARERQVQGQALALTELVQARVARVAALIAGCDALAAWCGTLLDVGYRCEVESMIAKVFASQAVKEAAFDLALPTHGGRFFLRGHATGDNAYDYLAPCIYEGENELLGLAIFHALAKKPTHSVVTSSTADDWQATAAEVEQLLPDSSGRVLGTQAQRLEIATRIQTLTALAVIQSWQQLPTSIPQQTAADLLRQQLQRQLAGQRATPRERALEVEIGREILTADPDWLGEVVPYNNPLPYEQA